MGWEANSIKPHQFEGEGTCSKRRKAAATHPSLLAYRRSSHSAHRRGTQITAFTR